MNILKHIQVLLFFTLGLEFCYAFRAAVFEHAEQSHMTSLSPSALIQANLEYYKKAANVASNMGVQLIVFPEYGVFPSTPSRKTLEKFLEFIPDPKTNHINPCEESDKYFGRPILHNLSCIARNNSMIIIANMGDMQPCKGQKNCPDDGHFNYNTAVVFDRKGTLLAKYHKEHLFIESSMDLPTEEQDPTFECDLGRFAMFVCFDIVYKRIVDVSRWKNVDAILLPTMWVNGNPLFNSIQYFESWAIGNNVTLLAADIHLPGTSAIGSVIVDGRNGALVYTFNPDGQSKLLVADVNHHRKSDKFSSIMIITKNGSRKWNDDGKDVEEVCSMKVLKPSKDIYKDYRCLERDMKNFTLIKLMKSLGHVEACNNGMCCSLNYTADDIKESFYFGVYNGTFNVMNRYYFPEENCFIGRCDDLKQDKCVTFPMRSKTVFYNVNIKANFSTDFIYPSVMSSGMRLVSTNLWTFETSNRVASISFKSCGTNLLILGFKARCYDKDPPFEH